MRYVTILILAITIVGCSQSVSSEESYRKELDSTAIFDHSRIPDSVCADSLLRDETEDDDSVCADSLFREESGRHY